ncbi:MAG: right-handed parallel beta-helix repeat-containing protein [Alistipes sp.]|nr:right-handed parallel beta-helix repeat-containing protein [Alistipes sp.]
MKTRVMILTLALILWQSVMAISAVHELYVSPSGNDSNKGSAAEPLASMQGAVARAIALQEDTAIDGFVVNLAAGIYTQYEALEIDTSLHKPIEFRGSNTAERTSISGAMQAEQFTAVEDNLWRVRIPEVVRYGLRFEQIYINGERRFRAQSPNRGEFAGIKQVKHIPIDSTNLGRDIYGWEVLNITPNNPIPFGNECRTQYIGEDAPTSKNKEALSQPLITFFHKWDTTRRPLLHVDSCGVMTIAGRGVYPWNTIDTRSRFFAENDFNFLDAEGEWILSEDGWLYYIPCEGETIENTVCHIPIAQQFIKINGESIEQQVDGITFNNIDFTYASYLTPNEGNVQMQAAAGIGTVVEANFARNIHFADCTIAHTGLGGVWFKRGCSDCSVERCHIYDVGASGVKIGESTIRDNRAEITHHIKVDNNIIQHGGFVFPCAVGVIIFHSSDNQVTHNDIADFRYTGVSVGWNWGYGYSPAKRNIVEYNHIHHLGWAQLSDMGGVYTLGMSEGTSVSNNVLHDIYSLYYGGWGLYTDEGSTGIRIENNLVYNCKSGGFHQHYGKDNIVRNNIFAGQIRTQLEASRVEEHLSFEFSHNIIYYSKGVMCGINWANVGHKSDYNCYFCTDSEKKIEFQGISFDEWQKKGQDVNSIIADPQFADVAAGNFTPKNKAMLKKIGFKPFDYSKAGVYGSKAWRQKAELSKEQKEAFDKLVDDYEKEMITDW